MGVGRGAGESGQCWGLAGDALRLLYAEGANKGRAEAAAWRLGRGTPPAGRVTFTLQSSASSSVTFNACAVLICMRQGLRQQHQQEMGSSVMTRQSRQGGKRVGPPAQPADTHIDRPHPPPPHRGHRVSLTCFPSSCDKQAAAAAATPSAVHAHCRCVAKKAPSHTAGPPCHPLAPLRPVHPPMHWADVPPAAPPPLAPRPAQTTPPGPGPSPPTTTTTTTPGHPLPTRIACCP